MNTPSLRPEGEHGPHGAHDFDFLHGHWRVHNRRLRERLQGCAEWEVFEATQHVRALPGGIGNFDDFIAPDWRPGFVGMTLRDYSPQTRLWSLYWLDNLTGGLDARGLLQPPVVGSFDNGVGVFEGDDVLQGLPIRVRYIWSDLQRDSAHWAQEMSADGGAHWERNWEMRMQRCPG